MRLFRPFGSAVRTAGSTRKVFSRRLAVDGLSQRITPCSCHLPPSQVSGMVYVDQDADGVADETEPRLSGVVITLTGTSNDGDPVNLTTTTDGGGIYMFQGLEAGTYSIQATTPDGYTAGQSSTGVFGGTTGTNLTTGLIIPGGQSSGGYNFGELVPPPDDQPGDNGNHYGQLRPKGNNGVGNGEDPPPPGEPPLNDGEGTSPGTPGNTTGTPGHTPVTPTARGKAR